ncbi:MAG: cell division protein FtsA [Bdellovibrionota bacterium]
MSLYNKSKHLICGLDIGTTKVSFVISTVGPHGLEIVGVGSAANPGMRHGMVVNIDSTTDAVRKAREEAELMSGLEARRVWVSLGGSHIQSFDSSGMVAVRNSEVSQEDVNRVIEVAKAVAIPSDKQVLHVLPKDFKIDGQEGITDPLGMSGVRLECNVHIVTGSKTIIQNVLKVCERSGLEVAGLVLQQLATSIAVLSKDEKNLGVCVVDIGGGTTDLITYQRGSVVHTATIPVGGLNFTHDVAMGLRTTQVNADDLKRKYGSALPALITNDESIEVETVGGRQPRSVSRSSLCRVIEARAEETLKLIQKEITDRGYAGKLGSGIVLSGGASELAGFIEMGDFVFDMPARLGVPNKTGGLTDVVRSASFATVVGLLMYGFDIEKPKYVEPEADIISSKVNEMGRVIKGFLGRI